MNELQKPEPPLLPQYCVIINGNQAASQRFIKEVCDAEVGSQVDYGEHLVSYDEELVAIQHLRRLVLCNLRLTAIDTFMGRLHMLTHVNLSFNRITDVSSISLLPGLTVLDISHNKIIAIDAVRELTSLHTLRCHHNAIECLEPIVNLTNIKELWVSDNAIIWQEFICLMPLSNLHALVKAGNPGDGKDKFPAFIRALRPSLRSLDGVDLVAETAADKFHGDSALAVVANAREGQAFLKSTDGRVMVAQAQSTLPRHVRTILDAAHAELEQQAGIAANSGVKEINSDYRRGRRKQG